MRMRAKKGEKKKVGEREEGREEQKEQEEQEEQTLRKNEQGKFFYFLKIKKMHLGVYERRKKKP